MKSYSAIYLSWHILVEVVAVWSRGRSSMWACFTPSCGKQHRIGDGSR